MPPTRSLQDHREPISLMQRIRHLPSVSQADDFTSGKDATASATDEAVDRTAEQIEHILKQPEQQAEGEPPPTASTFLQAAMANEKVLRTMLKTLLDPLDDLQRVQDAFRLDAQRKVDQHVEAGFDLAMRLEKMVPEVPRIREHVAKMVTYMGKTAVPTPTTD